MAKRVPAVGRPALSGLSLSSLQVEIERRQRLGSTLLRDHARLTRQLSKLDAKLHAAGIEPGAGPQRGGTRVSARRPRNTTTLVEALAKALNGATMGVAEVADAVQRAGYTTTSPTFRTIVNIALIKSGRFRKVSRGQYTLKK